MPSNARTRKSAPKSHSVSGGITVEMIRTETEDKLWKALHANPNSTVSELCEAAKIGKSTAQKHLANWAAYGAVTRTTASADGGRRPADRWAVAEVGTAVEAEAIQGDNTEGDISGQAEVAAEEALDDDGDMSPEENVVGQTDAEVDEVQDMAPPEDADAVDADATGSAKTRLVPGGLRGMVEDYLRDHSGDAFGPSAIAKALSGRSAGAVSNALDKLVENGVAVKTQDNPKRFALAPVEQVTVPVAAL